MTKEIWVDGKLIETQDVDMSYFSRNQKYSSITPEDIENMTPHERAEFRIWLESQQ